MANRLLITGGLGYIGSHILAQLGNQFEIMIVDDLSNADRKTLDTISDITGAVYQHECTNVTDYSEVAKLLCTFRPCLVMHLAGKKSVPESIVKPIEYYQTNVGGTVSLLKAMAEANCRNIIFSSSATVYGNPICLPIDEEHPTNPTNPYGSSKLFAEKIIKDWCNAAPDRKAVCLRYFNPIGAHTSGKLYETGSQKSTNLMPRLLSVAAGKASSLKIYGANYSTIDGSGVRDYIHVDDLAEVHTRFIQTIKHLSSYSVYNVGTGLPSSVLQLVEAFEASNNLKIPTKITKPRNGDIAEVWASPKKIQTLLNWRAKNDIKKMCEDSWKSFKK